MDLELRLLVKRMRQLMLVQSFIVIVAEILSDSAFPGRNCPVLQAK